MNLSYLLKESLHVPENDPGQGVVLSSRVRLARNLAGKPFPGRASVAQRLELYAELAPVLSSLGFDENGFVAELDPLTEEERLFLLERHLISGDLVEGKKGSGLAARWDHKLAVMVNEEDHLRLQAFRPGFQAIAAWNQIDALDSAIEERVDYAFLHRFGYLTACPSNVGTGIRVSFLLHLPALFLLGEMDKVVRGLTKMSLAVRGFFGEGSDVAGHLLQVSNQVTLGVVEREVVQQLEKVARELVIHETNARLRLQEDRPVILQDAVGRAMGVLKYAHLITSREAMELLSGLRLGVELAMVPNINRSTLDDLLMLIQPGHLQLSAGQSVEPDERDVARAQCFRKKLQEIC